ncbi:MAG: hypothetical protein MUO59_07175, partial [Actinobacteria bacterium]|nr:hypothetical protein [Actinomycetota bacterium]
AVTFDMGNTFTEAQSKFFFTMAYPDNWDYTLNEDDTGMSVSFTSLNENETFATIMAVLNDSPPELTEADLLEIANQYAALMIENISEDMQQIEDTAISDGSLSDGSPYKEYVYIINDNSSAQKGEFGIVIDLIPKFGKMYLWIGFAPEIFYDQLQAAFMEGLESLVLEK